MLGNMGDKAADESAAAAAAAAAATDDDGLSLISTFLDLSIYGR